MGNFSVTPNSLLKRILKSQKIILQTDKKSEDKKSIKSPTKSEVEIIIGDEEGLDYKRCYCCRRQLPDQIVAHINADSDITIHKRECKILKKVNTDRLLSAYKK